MFFAICIPVEIKHFNLLEYCLRSIEAQTVKPDAVIVSVSNCLTPLDVSGYCSGFNLPLELLCTKDKLFAGGNRNRAAARAYDLGASHLSFFDADDIMHPKRIECIQSAFLNHPEITGFIHCFMVGYKGNMEIYKGNVPVPWEPISNDYMPSVFLPGTYGKLNIIKFQFVYRRPRAGYGMGHNGHITVTSEFWKETPYDETLARGQDIHFSANILLQKKLLGYTGDTLSLYMRDSHKEFKIGL